MAYKYFEGITTDEWFDMDTSGTTQSDFKNDGPGDLRVKADGLQAVQVKSGDRFQLITGYNTISVKMEDGSFPSFFRLLAQ